MDLMPAKKIYLKHSNVTMKCDNNYIPNTFSRILTGTFNPTYTIIKEPQSIKNIERESKLQYNIIKFVKNVAKNNNILHRCCNKK